MRSRPDQVASWGPIWREFLDDRLQYRGKMAELAGNLVVFEGQQYSASRARQFADKLSAMRRENGPHPEPASVFEVAVAFTLTSEKLTKPLESGEVLLSRGRLGTTVQRFVKRYNWKKHGDVRALSPLSYYYAAGQLDAYIDAFVYFRMTQAYDDCYLDSIHDRVVLEIGDGSGDSDIARFGRVWGTVLPPEKTREAVKHFDENMHISLAHALAGHFELAPEVQFHGVTSHLRNWVDFKPKAVPT